MDDIDTAILNVLQHSGRIPMTELAARVGLSPTPCARRVRSLEDAGVIRGYSALVDRKALGYQVEVLVLVRLGTTSQSVTDEFEARVAALPQVEDLCVIAGEYDYLLRVFCTDLEAFEQFTRTELRGGQPEVDVESLIVLKHV